MCSLQVRQGRSALHVACSAEGTRGRTARAWLPAPGDAAPCAAQLVQLMLRLGAPPDARDADGNTPLHLVCKVRATKDHTETSPTSYCKVIFFFVSLARRFVGPKLRYLHGVVCSSTEVTLAACFWTKR